MRIRLVAALVGFTALAGCAPVAPAPTPTPTQTVTSTPTVSATPIADDGSGLSALALSPEGIGPIHMGEQVPADAALATLDPTYCDINHPDSGHGGWIPNFPPTPVNGNYPFFIETAAAAADSPVIWITVASDQIRTAEGFGIGTSIAELDAFYGGSIETIATDMATAHVVQGTQGQLVFWGLDVVEGVEISAPGSAPVFNYTLMCN